MNTAVSQEVPKLCHSCKRSAKHCVLFLLQVLTVTLFLLSAGCMTATTYDGARQPKEAIGTLHLGAGLLNPYESVVVISIDGKHNPEWSLFKSRYRHFELLPGRHTVVVDHITKTDQIGNVQVFPAMVSRAGKKTVTLDVEAGHDYALKYSIRKRRVIVTDSVTGVTVADVE